MTTNPVPINLQPKTVPKIVPLVRDSVNGGNNHINSNLMQNSINSNNSHNNNNLADTHTSSSINIDNSSDTIINDGQSSFSREIKISLPSLADIHKEINYQIQNNVINILEEILQKLSKDKDLNYQELKTEYLVPLKGLMEVNQAQISANNNSNVTSASINRKQRKTIDPNEQCMARTSNSCQCSRKRQKNAEFCGSHLTSQPYGRIDQAPPQDNKPPKRRGRPPKKIITMADQPVDVNELHNPEGDKDNKIMPKKQSSKSKASLASTASTSSKVSKATSSITTKTANKQPTKSSTITTKETTTKNKSSATVDQVPSIVVLEDSEEIGDNPGNDDEITKVDFNIIEVSGKTCIIDNESGKIYDPPDSEQGGTIDIDDLHQIGQRTGDGTLVFYDVNNDV